MFNALLAVLTNKSYVSLQKCGFFIGFNYRPIRVGKLPELIFAQIIQLKYVSCSNSNAHEGRADSKWLC